jgi:hypothetical protein
MTRSIVTPSRDLQTIPLTLGDVQRVVEDHEGRVTALEGFSATGVVGIPLNSFRKDALQKDAMDDAAGSSLLGLADAIGSLLLGGDANNTSLTDYANVLVAIPPDYVAGGALTVRLRAKQATALSFASAKVDVDFVKVCGDSLGADINPTAAQQVTTAYVAYDFPLTPTNLVAGDILAIRVACLNNDTGGSSAGGVMSISKAELRYARAA